MTTDLSILAGSSPWKWWPCFAAGFFGPLLGLQLARWLTFHFAIGVSFFILWFLAGLILFRRSKLRRGTPAWLAAVISAAAAGIGGAILSFFFSWNIS